MAIRTNFHLLRSPPFCRDVHLREPWWVWTKHIVSLYDTCYAKNATFKKELWDEKITYSLNYLFLLTAIIREETAYEQNWDKNPELFRYPGSRKKYGIHRPADTEGSSDPQHGRSCPAVQQLTSSSLITAVNIFASVIGISSGSTYPRLAVRLPWGSVSTSSTLFPSLASPIHKFIAVVVLATPPFWFATAITLPILQSPFSHDFSDILQKCSAGSIPFFQSYK